MSTCYPNWSKIYLFFLCLPGFLSFANFLKQYWPTKYRNLICIFRHLTVHSILFSRIFSRSLNSRKESRENWAPRKAFAFSFACKQTVNSLFRYVITQHCIILPWSVSCSNCIMLWWSDPDSNDGRISVLDSINGGVPYPGAIDSRQRGPPAGVGGKASSLGILSSKVPVPQLAVSHIPVSGCSATKQTECVNFSTYVFNVKTGLNGKLSSIYNRYTNCLSWNLCQNIRQYINIRFQIKFHLKIEPISWGFFFGEVFGRSLFH